MSWKLGFSDLIGKAEATCNVTCPEMTYECPKLDFSAFHCPEVVCPVFKIPELSCGDITRGETICPEIKCPSLKCDEIVCPKIEWPEFKCPLNQPTDNMDLNCPQLSDNSTAVILLIAFLIFLAILIVILQIYKIRKLQRRPFIRGDASQLTMEMPREQYQAQISLTGNVAKSPSFPNEEGEYLNRNNR